MNIKEKIIPFIKQKFVLNAGDPNYIRKSKFLNILLFICGSISSLIFLIPPIFTLFETSFGFEERIVKIYSRSLILLVGIIVILIIKKFVSKQFASILFIILITLLVFLTSDLELVSSGVLIFWYFLPVLLSSLLLRSIWSIVITFVIFIIILLNHFVFGLFPRSLELAGFFIFASISLFSSRVLESSLMHSQRSEKNTKDAYNRVELYTDLFSHDISNIFQNIQTFIDLCTNYLIDPSKVEDIEELLRIANQQIYRGSNLVSNVRNLTELEKSKQQLIKKDTILILNQAIDKIKNDFSDISLKIEIDSVDKNVFTKSNQMLTFLFENILRNSITHNENLSIEILIKISEELIDDIGYVKFEIFDNGVGIPDSIKEKIFQRGLENSADIGGIGLGLTLVNKIVEYFDGQIKVEDKIKGNHSQGSIFTVLLPTIE